MYHDQRSPSCSGVILDRMARAGCLALVELVQLVIQEPEDLLIRRRRIGRHEFADRIKDPSIRVAPIQYEARKSDQ